MKNLVSWEILIFYLATNAHSSQHFSPSQNLVFVHWRYLVQTEIPPAEESISFGLSVKCCEVLRYVHPFSQGSKNDPNKEVILSKINSPNLFKQI